MKLAAILATLARLLDWFLDRQQGRREAEIENEVRDNVAKDATIADLQRARQIDGRVADVRLDDRLRRADRGSAADEDGYRD